MAGGCGTLHPSLVHVPACLAAERRRRRAAAARPGIPGRAARRATRAASGERFSPPFGGLWTTLSAVGVRPRYDVRRSIRGSLRPRAAVTRRGRAQRSSLRPPFEARMLRRRRPDGLTKINCKLLVEDALVSEVEEVELCRDCAAAYEERRGSRGCVGCGARLAADLQIGGFEALGAHITQRCTACALRGG